MSLPKLALLPFVLFAYLFLSTKYIILQWISVVKDDTNKIEALTKHTLSLLSFEKPSLERELTMIYENEKAVTI